MCIRSRLESKLTEESGMVDIVQLRQQTQTLHILYVEDEEIIREETKEILSELFASVVCAGNGREGIEKYDAFYTDHGTPFDIVLTDINMPEMNGIEMIAKIREKVKHQIFFVISAHNESEYLSQLIDLGVQQFLRKPLEIDQLFDSLSTTAASIINEEMAKRYYEEIEKENTILEERVKERTMELERRLYIDHMTELHNRYALVEDLERQKLGALILIDVDRFQFINDLYGTQIGNEVIKRLAQWLKKFVQPYGYRLYRASGDEFAIGIKRDEHRERTFFEIFESKITDVKFYFSQIEDEIDVDLSVGVACGGKNLLSDADIALKQAKKSHKRILFYTESTDTVSQMQDLLRYKRLIKDAIAENRVVAVFQPIVDVSGHILKYETLMRLKTIEKDTEVLLTPYHFLEIAEQTKLYPLLSREILSQALHVLEREPVTLSVNLTYRDILDRELDHYLYRRIERGDLGERLIFEIVENEQITDYGAVRDFLKKYRTLGVRIAIDDFGSGYSNFEHIMQIAPDYIKIDGSLVKKIDSESQAKLMVEAIVHFCKKLGICVIAEYVHNEAVFEILRKMGVGEFQGYYFFAPRPTLQRGAPVQS